MNENYILPIGLGIGSAFLISKMLKSNSNDTFKSVSSTDKIGKIIIPIENSLGAIVSDKTDLINKVFLDLPKTSKQFYNNTAKNANAVKIKQIIKTHYSTLKLAEKLTKVPAYILAPIIFAESGGNIRAKSYAKAYGLMQMITQGANDTILQENIKGRLSDEEKTIIRKHIGSRLDNILRMKFLGHKPAGNGNKINFITEEDMYNPEFSILTGAMLIGMLIDQHIEDGNKLRLEKSMLRYGRGYFYKPKGSTFEETLNAVKNYKENYTGLIKYFGQNGLFQTGLQVVKELSQQA